MSQWQMWQWSWLLSSQTPPVCIFSQGSAWNSSQKASLFRPSDSGRRACFSPGPLAPGKHSLSSSLPFAGRDSWAFSNTHPEGPTNTNASTHTGWEHVISSTSCLFNGCSSIVFLAVRGSRMLSQITDFQRTEAQERVVQSDWFVKTSSKRVLLCGWRRARWWGGWGWPAWEWGKEVKRCAILEGWMGCSLLTVGRHRWHTGLGSVRRPTPRCRGQLSWASSSLLRMCAWAVPASDLWLLP